MVLNKCFLAELFQNAKVQFTFIIQVLIKSYRNKSLFLGTFYSLLEFINTSTHIKCFFIHDSIFFCCYESLNTFLDILKPSAIDSDCK